LKVGIFYSSISNIHKAPHKAALMDAFKTGVMASNDTVIDFKTSGTPIVDLDVGFILGYTLENNYRKRIIDTLKLQKSKIVYVDSNIYSYGRSANFYHRYSVNSVYPVDGEYFLGDTLDYSKSNTILKYHKLELNDWRTNGNHILVLAQKTMSWNMLGKNGLEWVHDVVKRIRKISDRPIVIRLHPGDKKFNDKNKLELIRHYGKKHVKVSSNENIKDDLTNAWCAVGYNSTPNCASIIQGVPVYLDDPLNSWARGIGFEDINQIDTPPMPDRTDWLHKIANIHWSNDEVTAGHLWAAIKSYISSVR
jgi:hypothetical protein